MDHLTLIKHHFIEVATTCWYCSTIKTFGALALGSTTFLFGIHNVQILGALGALMVFDIITALSAAKIQGVPIESRRFFKGASKFLAYLIMVSGAYLAEGIIPGDTFIFEAMVSFLALTELISIMENVGKMGYTVPQKLLNQLNELRHSK